MPEDTRAFSMLSKKRSWNPHGRDLYPPSERNGRNEYFYIPAPSPRKRRGGGIFMDDTADRDLVRPDFP